MPLTLPEMRLNAIRFAREWKDSSRERADAQTFWNEFFAIFGRSRKLVASFEEPVKNLKGQFEYIDLFWPGMLVAEHKSRGKDLDKANSQAIGYVHNLINSDRADEAPSYLIISDFARIALHNLEDQSESVSFPLEDLHKHVRRFTFIAGPKPRKLDPADPANERAVAKLANLHDQLEKANFTGHHLERFLVRILFCLFAEDTGIFEDRDEPKMFRSYLLNHTKADGSDLGPQLARLFQTLDKPRDQRPPNLPADLNAFPYVNGQLFAETLEFPEFTAAQRNALLDCAHFQWARISPAIFGSLFQDVIAFDKSQENKRRQIGAHYTSEEDILKLIGSLFLDDLRREFAAIRRDKKALVFFHRKIAALRFLDPACGCGNFLVIAYRELRRLELDVLKARFGETLDQGTLHAECRVDIDQMFGMELEEWPARIAEVALWLLDHQMNTEVTQAFEQYYIRLPLKKAATIRVGNALRTDWNSVLDHERCSYVMGNPPFVGKQFMTAEQKADMAQLQNGIRGAGLLDYVCAWYLKAAQYVQNTRIRGAFVATNSIVQGEQPGILWPELFRRGLKIHFAHRTFDWQSEARGKAQVDVVIIGFGAFDGTGKRIYDYELDPKRPTVTPARNISPYLTDGGDTALSARSRPLCKVPAIVFGSMPNDGGALILDAEEREALLAQEPKAERFLRPFVGAQEFLDGVKRWCLWLVDATAGDIRTSPFITKRMAAVREHRLKSKRGTTRELANEPSLFGEIRQPSRRYLLIPSVSSEMRHYIPMGFMPAKVIASNLVLMIPGATDYEFGVLSSRIHMAWVRNLAGRLESRFRYSNQLVYNNFPWPENPSSAAHRRVVESAHMVLEAREPFLRAGDTFAQLYDPNSMPPKLAHAHAELDRAVDRAYRVQPFPSDRHRFEFLFALYERLASPLTAPVKTRRR